MARGKELLVGLVVAVGFAVLIYLSMKVDDEGKLFAQGEGRRYEGIFRYADTLSVGAPVLYSGLQVGRVESVELLRETGEVKVRFFIHERDVRLRQSHYAKITTGGVLAVGRRLEIFPKPDRLTPDRELAPGDRIDTEETSPVSINELTSAAKEALDAMQGAFKQIKPAVAEFERTAQEFTATGKKAQELLADTRSGKLKGILPYLLASEEGTNQLRRVLDDANLAVGNIRNVVGDLQQYVKNPEGLFHAVFNDKELQEDAKALVKRANNTTGKAEKLVETLHAGLEDQKGVLWAFLHDQELKDDAKATIKNARKFSANLTEKESLVGQLTSKGKIYEDVVAVVDRARAVLTKIDEGHGTLGRLVNDDRLYREGTGFLKKARELAEDAQEQTPISSFTSLLVSAFR